MPKPDKATRRKRPKIKGIPKLKGGRYELTTDVEVNAQELTVLVSGDNSVDGQLLSTFDVTIHCADQVMFRAVQNILMANGIQDGTVETKTVRSVINRTKKLAKALDQFVKHGNKMIDDAKAGGVEMDDEPAAE